MKITKIHNYFLNYQRSSIDFFAWNISKRFLQTPEKAIEWKMLLYIMMPSEKIYIFVR